jgi:hypothetical protein
MHDPTSQQSILKNTYEKKNHLNRLLAWRPFPVR